MMNIEIIPAQLEDVGLIKQIASHYRAELGYVMYPALRESIGRGELLIAQVNGQSPLGFVNFHARRDGWHTIYEIAVAPSLVGKGVGKALFVAVPRPVRLKCTLDNDRANAFYAARMTLVRVEQGRKHPLNVWELE